MSDQHLPRQTGDAPDLQTRLERAERLVACFQKAVGHELPNHLVALRGFARLLGDELGGEAGVDARAYLDRLTAAAERIQVLVAALAEIGRTVRDLPPPEWVGLAEAAREAGSQAKQLFPAAVIEYHFPEHDLKVLVPRPAVRQVLHQFLRNAAQAALPGRADRIEVGADPAPHGVTLWVRDHGRGLSPQRQARLFEPFPGSDGPSAGAGLGLFFARLLVEGWGGRVGVESEPGAGSRFTATIPVAERPAAASQGGTP